MYEPHSTKRLDKFEMEGNITHRCRRIDIPGSAACSLLLLHKDDMMRMKTH